MAGETTGVGERLRPKKGRTPRRRHEACRRWRRRGVAESAVDASSPGKTMRPEMAAEM